MITPLAAPGSQPRGQTELQVDLDNRKDEKRGLTLSPPAWRIHEAPQGELNIELTQATGLDRP